MKVIQQIGYQKWTAENGLDEAIVDTDAEEIEEDCLYSPIADFSASDYVDLIKYDEDGMKTIASNIVDGSLDFLIHIAIYSEDGTKLAYDSIYESELLKKIYSDEEIRQLAEEYEEERE